MATDLEVSWARTTGNWTIGREFVQYPVGASGRRRFTADASIFKAHGYVVHSSALMEREGIVTVAFTRGELAHQYESLGLPGAGAFPPGGNFVSVSSLRGSVGNFIKLGAAALAVAFVYIVLWSPGPSGTSSSQGIETPCETAFLDASDGRISGPDEYDLDPAMRACGSLAEWMAGWRKHPPPGIAGGSDPAFIAENRCMTGKFSSTNICRELGVTP